MSKNKQLGLIIMGLIGTISLLRANDTDRIQAERPLVLILEEMQQQYQVVFSYTAKDVRGISMVFEIRPEEDVETAIKRALAPTDLRYRNVGLNFYVIYKDSAHSKRKVRRIERKINQIKRLGNEDSLFIFNHQTSQQPSKQRGHYLEGRITNLEGEPLIGASVALTGSHRGTTTNARGAYGLSLESSQLEDSLQVSYTGYTPRKVAIARKARLDIQLAEGLLLEAITVFGSRGSGRTHFNSPVPIDHLSWSTLTASGENSLDEQLTQVVPSFHSGQHPVSDAAAHFNPVDLRGLLPSRTLVLINGKRKNTSALLYSYVTASRGEVGVDLKSIEPSALEAVEVLRDGAAAQYGSDAIAGVLNLKMKERIKPFAQLGYGITSELDGAQLKAATGFSVAIKEKGFVTFTLGYLNQQRSQRAGTISSAADEANYWGDSVFSLPEFEAYLQRNPSGGFQVGIPDMETMSASFNARYPFLNTNNIVLYAFGNIMGRTGRSPQFARGPYWVQGFEAIYPEQDYFLPEMAPRIADQSTTVGIKQTHDDWKIDLSTTLGSSKIAYYIENSFNQSLGAASPKDFYNGTHRFLQWVNNLDVHRTLSVTGLEQVDIAFGLEQRLEGFTSAAGEFASYGDGTPNINDRIGSESFSGLKPQDALTGSRSNIGAYTEAGLMVGKLSAGTAFRIERYSDFGNNLSWKWHALYKLVPEKLNLRASINNGFRAPALHQILYSSTTTTLTPKGIVQNRILNNLSPALEILQIPKLKPVTSFNLTAGFGSKLTDKLTFSVDFYHIKVDDRIVLSGQIGYQENQSAEHPINRLLDATQTGSVGFFLNAVNTTTNGADVVFSIDELRMGKGHLKSTVAANFTYTKVGRIQWSPFIEDQQLDAQLFSREDVSRIETWRPREKAVWSNTYTTKRFSAFFSLNYFGRVIYRHPQEAINDAVYRSRVITNLNFGYAITPRTKIQLGVQNLLNVYPDTFTQAYQGVPQDRSIDFVGRFQYPWQTIQTDIDGRRYFTKMMVQL